VKGLFREIWDYVPDQHDQGTYSELSGSGVIIKKRRSQKIPDGPTEYGLAIDVLIEILIDEEPTRRDLLRAYKKFMTHCYSLMDPRQAYQLDRMLRNQACKDKRKCPWPVSEMQYPHMLLLYVVGLDRKKVETCGHCFSLKHKSTMCPLASSVNIVVSEPKRSTVGFNSPSSTRPRVFLPSDRSPVCHDFSSEKGCKRKKCTFRHDPFCVKCEKPTHCTRDCKGAPRWRKND
jgi:hypothetical protein